jgi:hypothetical protein
VKTSDVSNEIEQLINEMTEIICKIRQNRETNDDLEIWRISHIPQKDGELDMMLISCNILFVLTEILLKVALITISQTKSIINCHKSF